MVLYLLLVGVTACVEITLFAALTRKFKLFWGIGFYWIENGILYIETDHMATAVKHVQEIMGSTPSYCFDKCARLEIITENKHIKLYSVPMKWEQGFEDSSVYPIYKLVLEREPSLEIVKIFNQDSEYWYKNTKAEL